MPDGGFPSGTDCSGAQLRLRISRLEVGHQGKQVWLPTGTLDGAPQSYYCVVQATPALPLQPIIAGRYHDTFQVIDGQWWFATRTLFVDLMGDLSQHLKWG